jgi:hypothetical protein
MRQRHNGLPVLARAADQYLIDEPTLELARHDLRAVWSAA